MKKQTIWLNLSATLLCGSSAIFSVINNQPGWAVINGVLALSNAILVVLIICRNRAIDNESR